MSSWLEAAIIAVILLGIVVAIYKGGAANPVSTGGLGSRLNTMDGDLRALTTKVDTVEISVGAVETRVSELNKLSATKGDVERLEKHFQDYKRQIDSLDERMDAFDRDLTAIRAMAASNQPIIEAMAESIRHAGDTMQQIERKVDATASITAQVPSFIERVLTDVSRTIAQTEHNAAQVARLYDFIVERGMSK